MNKISVFFNYLITLIALLLLVFAWGIYFTDNIAVAIVFSISAFIIFSLAFFLVKDKKEKKRNVKNMNRKKREKLSLNLKIINPKNMSEFLKSLLPVGEVISENDNSFQTESANYFFFFDVDEVGENELCKALREANFNKEITIFCQSVTQKARNLAERFAATVSFVDLDGFQTLMEENNASLELTEILEKAKPKPLLVLKSMAEKQKIKGYLLVALMLLLFSFISPFKLYYQIFASALIIFCIVIYFLKI